MEDELDEEARFELRLRWTMQSTAGHVLTESFWSGVKPLLSDVEALNPWLQRRDTILGEWVIERIPTKEAERTLAAVESQIDRTKHVHPSKSSEDAETIRQLEEVGGNIHNIQMLLFLYSQEESVRFGHVVGDHTLRVVRELDVPEEPGDRLYERLQLLIGTPYWPTGTFWNIVKPVIDDASRKMGVKDEAEAVFAQWVVGNAGDRQTLVGLQKSRNTMEKRLVEFARKYLGNQRNVNVACRFIQGIKVFEESLPRFVYDREVVASWGFGDFGPRGIVEGTQLPDGKGDQPKRSR